MKPFYLQRNIDVSGVSGTGRVMEGVVLPDGRVCSTWLSDHPSCTVHTNIYAAKHIHGHGGSSEFVFFEPNSSDHPCIYRMIHSKDWSGLTKIGEVADIAEFSNGKVVLAWLVEPFQIEFFDSMKDLKFVHLDDYTTLEEVS